MWMASDASIAERVRQKIGTSRGLLRVELSHSPTTEFGQERTVIAKGIRTDAKRSALFELAALFSTAPYDDAD